MQKYRIGRMFGVDIFLHFSTVLFVFFIFFAGVLSSNTASAFSFLVQISVLFFCIILHEYGHVLTARQFGVGTKDVTLYPFGGMAALESIPKRPLHELLMAAAGPLVNLMIALFLYLPIGLMGHRHPSLLSGMQWVQKMNFFIALFNLLPALPMDGGRILRATLAMRMEYFAASELAVKIAKFCAVTMAIYAILTVQMMMLFIAFMLYFAGDAEVAAQKKEASKSDPE